MNFKVDNILLVKQLFSFGLWTVSLEEGHVFQTTEVPILIYHLPEKSMECRPRPRTLRRNLVEQDQVLYDRYILRPNSIYVEPPGTSYLILIVQKTLFAVDVMAWEDVQNFTDFHTHKHYSLSVYNLPPPTPAHEMQVPHMVLPEERRWAKRPRLSEYIQEPQLQIVSPSEMFSSPEIDPEPEFVSPPPEIVPEDNQEVDHIISSNICQDSILIFLNEFEQDVCASFAAEPAHQIQLDGPNFHQPPSLAAMVSPPIDNYWAPNDIENCDILDCDLDGFGQDAPMDLATNNTVSESKKIHVFSSGTGALDLRNK